MEMFQGPQTPVIVQQATSWVTIVLALIAALPAVTASVIAGMTLLQSRRNAEVAASTESGVTKNLSQSAVIIDKATEIHTLANNTLSKVQTQLDVANEKINGFNIAQAEAIRKMTNMELLISSLIPLKGEPTPSQINGEKLDSIMTKLTNVQEGTPPIPVEDKAVLEKLNEVVIGKLDTIQETVEHTTPPKE